MTAGFDGTVGVAGKKHRQVVMRVPIAIADGAAVHNHAVVEQCAIAFLDALEAIQKMREEGTVVTVNFRKIPYRGLRVTVMTNAVMPLAYAEVWVATIVTVMREQI